MLKLRSSFMATILKKDGRFHPNPSANCDTVEAVLWFNIKRKWLLQGGNLAGFFYIIQRSRFFEEAVLLRGFVFKGPRGFGASNGLVVFNVTSAVSFTLVISFSYGDVRE